jgi:hypothetical protein
MASEEHDDDCCPNYVPMNMAKSAHDYCIAENKRLMEENAKLKTEIVRLKAETIKQIEAAMPPVEAYISKLECEVERLTKAIESSSYYFLSIKLQAEVERLNDIIIRGASVPDAKPISE